MEHPSAAQLTLGSFVSPSEHKGPSQVSAHCSVTTHGAGSVGTRGAGSVGACGAGSVGACGAGSVGACDAGSVGACGAGSVGACGAGSVGAHGAGSVGACGVGSVGACGAGSVGACGAGSVGACGAGSMGACGAGGGDNAASTLTATFGLDYNYTSLLQLEFSDVGQTAVMSSSGPTILALEDGCVEGMESFICAMQVGVSPGDTIRSMNPDTVTVKIIDEDRELMNGSLCVCVFVCVCVSVSFLIWSSALPFLPWMVVYPSNFLIWLWASPFLPYMECTSHLLI